MHQNLASKFDIHIQFNNRKRQTSGIMITIHNNKQIGQQRCRNYYASNSESETMQLKKLQQTNKRLCNAHCVCYTNNIIDGQYTQVLLMYTLSSKTVFFVAGKSLESCTLS
ncbi:hypothetical protein BATDEDRAFT_27905 [Batrachochytrium dendrobatidis JAM81]|uniref:Uncharacterized protein n=1 Tax=Batrachochytrium dendrobatidis (strain JAM81 / FGSC 10211) TaxID=684364 RepID=F4PC12_BATDJ|nr:uncharacterized protein BATDEDRAFT_27905 [Batrachochytrium dendrobatidis JAM81]EGF77107.1 hypothetical protein BATDEDRAFT_27905 [Batrachochytrium dendrobatidis JAM81]|eukprot:XP_006682188.1 hypothetical protein BATDEDRAFT_27905 [Batrachochytrium dendrobatidis JAM81]